MSRVLLTLLFSVSIPIWAANVNYDRGFAVKSTPDIWSPGSQICFKVDRQADECAKVTEMGEIQLRFEGAVSADVQQNFVAKLAADEQKTVSEYNKFVVRYLALDGQNEGRYIIQIFFNVGPGTQAIYAYGNFQWPAGGGLELDPKGYGEAGRGNLSFLRTSDDDQRAIAIATKVSKIWASSLVPGKRTLP